MKYATIREHDVSNGEWIRISIFVSWCRHKCIWCFNAVAWWFDYGTEYTQKDEEYILSKLEAPYYAWLSVLWGEPLEPENQEQIAQLIVKTKKKFPTKDIWLYSWFTYEEIVEKIKKEKNQYLSDILNNIDVLVDGKFEIDKKDLSLVFRGSSNQRIIDVPQTLKTNTIVNKKLYN